MISNMAPKPPTPAQLKALKDSKGVKPTAAITKPGQKATGLAKSTVKDRFASTATTPVKKAGSGFAGSSGSLGSSLGVSKITKGNVANAVVAATFLPGSGQVTRYVGSKIAGSTAKTVFGVASKGLEASGAGGKVKNVMTPFGKTLGSTRIGSPAQQAASMGGLIKRAENIATGSAQLIAGKVVRGMNTAGNIVKTGVTTAVVAPPVVKKVLPPVKKALLGKPPVKKK
jgi:hypothetical protein